MTKAQEIQALRNVATLLGPNSYCGPWLAGITAEVESAVRSDFFPDITLDQSRKRAVEIVSEATVKAEEILKRAQTEADRLVAVARQQRDDIISSTRDRLRAASQSL